MHLGSIVLRAVSQVALRIYWYWLACKILMCLLVCASKVGIRHCLPTLLEAIGVPFSSITGNLSGRTIYVHLGYIFLAKTGVIPNETNPAI